eukprot:TRINITY_DN26749_c0_g1_i1.p1 TRINITY_DN26749_c0_g1~~TRINITY_DN26749_c0_g1_i1.p1  ORF type:complete len:387 (-),score=70.76 TRINITY_DN26749_c0_g1_i1:813-1973(-)
MSGGMINVDPEKQSDLFYRYKMPKTVIKIEGSGNGIKTVLPNIAQIAERIARPVEYPVRFFAHELAAMAHFKDEKWILMGSFTQETIQKSLFDFIKKFVLCKKCRNPETEMTVDEKKNIWLNCKACSRVTPVDPREKLCNNILKTMQPTSSDGGKKAKKGKTKKTKSKDEKEEEEYNRQTRQARDGETVVAAAPEAKENPCEVLRKFIQSDAKPDVKTVVGKVFDLKQDYGLNDKLVIALVFEAVFTEQISAELKTISADILKRVLKPETEPEVILRLQLLCADFESLKPKFHIILKKMYDIDLISETTILEWHQGKPTKAVSKDLQKTFREKCQPFVDWLKEADEESDSDDESDGGAEDGEEDEAGEAAKPADDDDDSDVDIDNI